MLFRGTTQTWSRKKGENIRDRKKNREIFSETGN
jgi:hypothetical protein